MKPRCCSRCGRCKHRADNARASGAQRDTPPHTSTHRALSLVMKLLFPHRERLILSCSLRVLAQPRPAHASSRAAHCFCQNFACSRSCLRVGLPSCLHFFVWLLLFFPSARFVPSEERRREKGTNARVWRSVGDRGAGGGTSERTPERDSTTITARRPPPDPPNAQSTQLACAQQRKHRPCEERSLALAAC